EVKLWDAQAGKERGVLARPTNVKDLAFSPNGQTLATAGIDKAVRLWDVATGRPVATFAGHTARVMGVAFSPDGLRLASVSFDAEPMKVFGKVRAWGELKLWDVPGGRLLATVRGHDDLINRVVFSPDGQTLATAGDDGA